LRDQAWILTCRRGLGGARGCSPSRAIHPASPWSEHLRISPHVNNVGASLVPNFTQLSFLLRPCLCQELHEFQQESNCSTRVSSCNATSFQVRACKPHSKKTELTCPDNTNHLLTRLAALLALGLSRRTSCHPAHKLTVAPHRATLIVSATSSTTSTPNTAQ
jgi:hypothetical protein